MKRRSFIKGLLGIVTLPIAAKVVADTTRTVGFSQTEPFGDFAGELTGWVKPTDPSGWIEPKTEQQWIHATKTTDSGGNVRLYINGEETDYVDIIDMSK